MNFISKIPDKLMGTKRIIFNKTDYFQIKINVVITILVFLAGAASQHYDTGRGYVVMYGLGCLCVVAPRVQGTQVPEKPS